MSTFSGIRSGLAANLARIPGLRTYNYIPDQINPPVAVVGPSSVTYDTAFSRGSDEVVFDAVVIVARADEKAAQDALDTYCDSAGSASVKAAIEYDRTLGGAVIDARVTDLTSYQSLAVGEVQYLAATFRISIVAN